jgi:hypothetical protein
MMWDDGYIDQGIEMTLFIFGRFRGHPMPIGTEKAPLAPLQIPVLKRKRIWQRVD